MLPNQYRRKKKEANTKPKIHQKIADNFIENAISKSNLATLKTLYYLATVLSESDIKNIEGDKIIGIRIDKRSMLKYTRMSAPAILQSVKKMQETSITFVDESDGIIEGMSLLPRYKLIPNRNIIEIDLYTRIAHMIITVKKNYTLMNIQELMKLRKAHSIRMLALLNKMAKDGEVIHMSLEDLNEFFGVNYKKWNMIEKAILKPVKEELDTHTSRSFTYEANYEILGRGRPAFRDVTVEVVEKPRIGWEEKFKNSDNELILDDRLDVDT